ncbi:stage V sporulation protein AA [Jeotgalibacillus terrae]|uniref:Stage V sporulation protein AA n=1 Tax=Jeotgalibacillus terrae TaxID=587735 RepID=A0ABW5ZJ80_9BACL|nr:stage V sporulation protein AA [Jeotgalibacillus terrae]MBM7577484.1 stage V sporulation protein AA [Jeotgalibacillus terrae]
MDAYIEMKSKAMVKEGPVTLNDIAEIFAEDHLKQLLMCDIVLKDVDGRYSVISRTDLQRKYQHQNIIITGSALTIVERMEASRSSVALLITVWLLLFTGSALTIMYFHEDVSMAETQMVIVSMLGNPHPFWFQIPYSIGIGAGMLLFFNRIIKKQFNDEPSPLDIEIYKYEKSVEDYVKSADRRDHE